MFFSRIRGSALVSALAGWLFLIGGAAALLPAAVIPALAQSDATKALVDAAKARGAVGEQADGFLGFVMPAADPALAGAVAEINAGRAQVYRETAARTGVTADAAGQATAQQLFARLPAGQYFKPLNGNWVRK
jgi:uncharacterized protein YdbL (DUF1318 family)